MSADRVGTDEFAITHKFLGQMLGSRRATVTVSAGVLQAAGLITYHRGRVIIVDRASLEALARECYGVTEAELDGVVSQARGELVDESRIRESSPPIATNRVGNWGAECG